MIIAYQSLAYHVKKLFMFDVMLQSVLEIDNGKLINIKNTNPGFQQDMCTRTLYVRLV